MSEDLIKHLNPAFSHIPELKKVLTERSNAPELPILSINSMNDKLWGLKRKKLTLIAARPSIGKSSMAVQLAYDLAKQMKKVAFFSLEMTNEDILERIFCHEYLIDNQEIMRGNFKQYEQKFSQFSASMERVPLSISDCIGKSWGEIDKIINQLSTKPDVIFIDHLNAIKTGRNAKTDIDDYILNICKIAKHQNVAMVLCCQINRDNQKDEDKTPQLHELKGTGNLEEMADIVIMLHWPYKYKKEGQSVDKNKYLAIVGKNRNGPTGYIELHFKPESYTFFDFKKDESYEVANFDMEEQ